MFEIGLDLV
jgi:UDP:flavonoid glycosyltransferase YjiC (YdhE family)